MQRMLIYLEAPGCSAYNRQNQSKKNNRHGSRFNAEKNDIKNALN